MFLGHVIKKWGSVLISKKAQSRSPFSTQSTQRALYEFWKDPTDAEIAKNKFASGSDLLDWCQFTPLRRNQIRTAPEIDWHRDLSDLKAALPPRRGGAKPSSIVTRASLGRKERIIKPDLDSTENPVRYQVEAGFCFPPIAQIIIGIKKWVSGGSSPRPPQSHDSLLDFFLDICFNFKCSIPRSNSFPYTYQP